MQRFKILTLVDITETKQYRRDYNLEMEWEQQQNFVMLLQTIGMRVNPLYDSSPLKSIVDLKTYHFGSYYTKTQAVWDFDFYIEYDGGLANDQGDSAGLLVNDLHLVPVISGLTETVNFKINVFDTKTEQFKNTIVYLLSS